MGVWSAGLDEQLLATAQRQAALTKGLSQGVGLGCEGSEGSICASAGLDEQLLATAQRQAALTKGLSQGVGLGCEGSEGSTCAGAGLDEQLLATAQRQAALTKGLPAQTRRRRLVAWLQRRGHGWSTISALLDRVGA